MRAVRTICTLPITSIRSKLQLTSAKLYYMPHKSIGRNEIVSIERTPKVMGGAACIRQTRIPVWLLEQARRLGTSEIDLLRNYPHLTTLDLTPAWQYVAQ